MVRQAAELIFHIFFKATKTALREKMLTALVQLLNVEEFLYIYIFPKRHFLVVAA